MNEEQMQELLYQALQTESGGVEVYETALRCVQNEDLQEEWEEYLEHTEHHVEILQEAFAKLDLDPEKETRAVAIVRHIGESLVKAMEMALESGAAGGGRGRRRRVRRARRDQGSPQLGADRHAGGQGQGRDGAGAP